LAGDDRVDLRKCKVVSQRETARRLSRRTLLAVMATIAPTQNMSHAKMTLRKERLSAGEKQGSFW
jgi:hypothetical protein